MRKLENKDINRVITLLKENTATSNTAEKFKLAKLLETVKIKKRTVKQVKKLVSDHMTDRKHGISVSLWGKADDDDIDRIVIKFPRNQTRFIGLSLLDERILAPNGFHVAQIMGFMERDRLWILLIRDRR